MTRAAVVLAVAGVVAACGREQWRAVDERLREAAAPAREAGLEPMAGRNNEFGTFTDTVSASWNLSLEAGRSYYLAAACVDDCGGVDLSIELPDGSGLVRDSSARTDARLSFVSRQSGEHQVRLHIARCTGGACRWAAQLYTTPASR